MTLLTLWRVGLHTRHTTNRLLTSLGWLLKLPEHNRLENAARAITESSYFREPSDAANGEHVTADVRLRDGTTASQIAAIDPGRSNDQIQFPGIDKAAVQEVLLTTSAGRCFVIGPNGS